MMLGSGVAVGALLCRPSWVSAAERLTYWHSFTSQSEFAGLARVIEQFQKANPELTVVQENIPNDDFMAKITAAILTESRPDTTMVLAERIDDLVAMSGLVDLTDRVNDWKLKDGFSDTAWQTITRDGKVYGVPAFTFVDWMYYRTDWFEEAGIEGPPKTLEEFATVAEKLTDPSKGRFGFGLRGGQGGGTYMINVLTLFGALTIEDGQAQLDRAAAIDALQWYSDLYTKQKVVPPSAPNDSYRQVMEAFRTGQTGMVWHHTGSLVEISQALKQGEQFMTAVTPAGPANNYTRVSYAYNGVMSEAQPDAAWDWVSYWGETDPEVAMLEETGYFPASKTAANDPRIGGNPIYQAAVATLDIGQPPPSFVGSNHWREDVVLPALQGVLIGSISVEQAVDAMIQGLEA
jgi:multiple sugar transport system substrate-binding protein